MNCALPSIGSTAGGIPELLDEECIFKSGDVEDLISKLKLQLDKSRLESNARKCFKTASEYDYDNLKKERDNFFKQIICELSLRTPIL